MFLFGLCGELNLDWSYDFLVVYGENSYDFILKNILNVLYVVEYVVNNLGVIDVDIVVNVGFLGGYLGGFRFD